MKQHITKEQWDKLYKEEKEQFETCFKELDKKFRDIGYDEEHINEYFFGSGFRLITIGVMMGFLGDDLNGTRNFQCSWEVVLNRLPSDNIFNNIELCDTLWEAVKYNLKRNEKKNNPTE